MNQPGPAPLLSAEQVLFGYDAVSRLYPHWPSLSAWRAWEFAAYQRYRLPEPVLDIGCGDGLFFQILWPGVVDAVGVDTDPAAVEAARRLGVYREVHRATADELPVPAVSFASAFANCSLEHMDHLPKVLAGVQRVLRPGGVFLLSVVTDKFLEWTTLPMLLEWMSEPARARALQAEYQAYHHVVNPLPPKSWVEVLENTGFEVLEHTPILPEMSSRLFLLIDQLWHTRAASGEVGETLQARVRALPRFPQAFGDILRAVLQMERDWTEGSGAVFWARRGA